MLAACGTTPAPEFNGKWRPVNRFSAEPQAIPLNPAYTFHATPLDGTLRQLLARWSEDARLGLSYQVGNDYTLHAPVSTVRTTSAEHAAAELDRLYAPQGVQITLQNGSFVVRPRPQPEAAGSPDSP
ncbi:hypothetical protein [Luteimonas sp. e5]